MVGVIKSLVCYDLKLKITNIHIYTFNQNQNFIKKKNIVYNFQMLTQQKKQKDRYTSEKKHC